MNRFTKTALVLLYLFQLMVVFRETLEHMYEVAIESVHKRTGFDGHSGEHADGKGGGTTVASGTAPMAAAVTVSATRLFHEQLAAAVILMLPQAILHGHHVGTHHPHPPHEHDKHKDRTRRFRHRDPRSLLIANLWERIRSWNAPQQRHELAEPVSRHLSFV